MSLILVLGSCQFRKELLNDPNQLNAANFYSTPDEINQGVIAGYGYLTTPRSLGAYGKTNYISRGDEFSSTHPMAAAGTMNFQSYGPDLHTLAQPWQFVYNAIFAVNAVIENIDKPTWGNNEQRDAYLGEAYFIRAYAHFYLLTNFRNIILATSNAKTNAELFRPQSEPAEVWDAIISDLQMAQQLLPEKGYWPEMYTGRVTKGAATGLLGKSYLYRSGFEGEDHYQKAAQEFEKIINGSVGSYSLVDYADNFFDFNENNDESVFELQFQLTPGEVKVNSNFQLQEGSTNGGNWLDARGLFPMGHHANGNTQAVHDWLLDAFLASTDNDGNVDPRVFGTLIFDDTNVQKRAGDGVYFAGRTGFLGILRPNGQSDENGMPIYEGYRGTQDEIDTAPSTGGTWNNAYRATQKKWINDTYSSDHDYQGAAGTREGEPNLRIIRYADVLLMYAEAAYKSGYSGSISAIQALNQVRQRQGVDMPPVSSIDMNVIENERILELSCEGHRIYDLIRWGTLESTFLQREADDPNFKRFNGNPYSGISGNVEKYKWYPIPALELSANPLAIQNPAWR